MTEKEFISWLKGYVEGVHPYAASPKQWQYLKDILEKVQDETLMDYTVGNWIMNHSWE